MCADNSHSFVPGAITCVCGDTRLRSTKSQAIDQVTRGARREWLDKAYAVLVSLATNNRELTADDVWESLEASTREKRAIGGVMRRGMAAGILGATDRVRESVLGNRRWKVRVWTSGLFVHKVAA